MEECEMKDSISCFTKYTKIGISRNSINTDLALKGAKNEK